MHLHVGLVGAGIGGMAAAIALRKAGAEVTVLEAAQELGEIGAGIQMAPNVSRLLRRWGVADVIGENLVQIKDINFRRYDGRKVGTSDMPLVEAELGQPWWVVHRAHLHAGLVEVARQEGATMLTDARVDKLEYEDTGGKVKVTTHRGLVYTFDLCIGSDGLNSIVRQTLFPGVKPEPPSNNCAYRAIVPYKQVQDDPMARELVEHLSMDVWMGDQAYIISYPISGGRDFNLVLSHHLPQKLRNVEQDVSVEEMKALYKHFDPRICRVLEMIPEVSRWPLMVTGPLESWSSPSKNVVLMGDAAHSMVNHMAQGAATSMEDGAFLAKCVQAVLQGRLGSLAEAVAIYEAARMPKAYAKQEISFLNGQVWQMPDGPEQEARDAAMTLAAPPELANNKHSGVHHHGTSASISGSNTYDGEPQTAFDLFTYDADEHAVREIERYCSNSSSSKKKTANESGVVDALKRTSYTDWALAFPPLGKILNT